MMNIYITFDYELFLGPKTGTVRNCLINPTNRYLEIAKKHNVRYTFFVDVTYLNKLQELKNSCHELEEDYNLIVEQLSRAASNGHSLQLHIHPQWYYSTYNAGWYLDFNHYKLSDCPLDDVAKMVNDGCQLIKEISGKQPTAFRAGGYSFPLDVERIGILLDNGIRVDSSVLPMQFCNSRFQEYDYRNIGDCTPYYFDSRISEAKEIGEFKEYPITITKISNLEKKFWNQIIRKKYPTGQKVCGDGLGVGVLHTPPNCKSLYHRVLSMIFGRSYQRASIDFGQAMLLRRTFWAIGRHNDDMVVIGHPKNATDVSFGELVRFISASKGCSFIPLQ